MAADPLADSIRLALDSDHAALAVRAAAAVRYPAEIAPFAAISGKRERDGNAYAPDEAKPHALRAEHDAVRSLASLMAAGETLYVQREAHAPAPVATAEIDVRGFVPCLQMIFPHAAEIPVAAPEFASRPQSAASEHGDAIVPLSCANSDEMLALIAIAFPGYFRAATCRMGEYFGVRDKDGTLVAMGGERLVLTDAATGVQWREISGLCTHPAHTGRGLSTRLMTHLLHRQRERGARSWLHVVDDNRRAIGLYERLGFETVRTVHLHRLVKVAEAERV